MVKKEPWKVLSLYSENRVALTHTLTYFLLLHSIEICWVQSWKNEQQIGMWSAKLFCIFFEYHASFSSLVFSNCKNLTLIKLIHSAAAPLTTHHPELIKPTVFLNAVNFKQQFKFNEKKVPECNWTFWMNGNKFCIGIKNQFRNVDSTLLKTDFDHQSVAFR